MSSTAVPPKRKVGVTTSMAASGAGVGYALGNIIAHFFPSLMDVREDLGIIITFAGALLGGYLAPPQVDAEMYELSRLHNGETVE